MALLDVFLSNKFKQLDDMLKDFKFGQKNINEKVDMFEFNSKPFVIKSADVPEFKALMKQPEAAKIP
jgi:hypothetical protein